MIEEKAYAKVNLTLEVFDKNKEGFHDLKTIMVPVDLYDVLTFEIINDGIILLDNTNIKCEDNIVYKAACLMFKKYNIKGGLLITLKKNIPSEAGLAGGSSDCAACLRGINKLYNLNLSLEELVEVSKELGSDVAYCIYSSPALCTGRGTNVELLDLTMPTWHVLLIKPPFGCSTKEIYSRYEYSGINKDIKHENVITSIKNNDLELFRKNIFNDLESVAFFMNPKLQKLSDNINYRVRALMSGSGSTIFVVSDNIDIINRIINENCKYLKTILTTFKNF